jgi:hypothetical protein
MKIGPFFNRRNRSQPPPAAKPAEERRPVSFTFTGELTQPVRLHYQLLDAAGAVESLKQLKCVGEISPGKSYKWYLADETKGAFKVNVALPKGESVSLGDILLDPAGAMRLHILVRSIERAWFAIEFFDRHVSRKQMKVTGMDLYHTLFEGNPESQTKLADLATLFPEERITVKDVEALPNLIKKAKKAGASQSEMLQMTLSFIESEEAKPLPEIEHLPLHFYKEGIHGIKSKLMLSQQVAWEHFNGNKGYTMGMAIEKITGTKLPFRK